MKSKELIIRIKIKCNLPSDYFTEEDLVKHAQAFKRLLQNNEVISFEIDGKMGEPLKGGKECNVINIARHLKS